MFLWVGLLRASIPEQYEDGWPLLTFAGCVGLFVLGRSIGWRGGAKQASQETLERLTSGPVQEFRGRFAALRSLAFGPDLFFEMREIVAEVYEFSGLLDEEAASHLHLRVFCGGEHIGGVPLNRFNDWVRGWNNICGGSLDRLNRIVEVRLCEHGTLYLREEQTTFCATLVCCREFSHSFRLEPRV